MKQNIVALKNINTSQYNTLKKIANDILIGDILLNKKQYNSLFQRQNFIRKLASGSISSTKLSNEIKTIIDILKIVFNTNEVCEQTSPTTNRRMGKTEETFASEKYSEDSRGGTTSSEDGDETTWNERNEEKEGVFECDCGC